MKVFIDTFSWAKLDLLHEKSLLETELIYKYFEVCITHDLLDEINHRGIKSCNVMKIHVLPRGNERIFEDTRSQGFDKADASIFSNYQRNEDSFIVTEDKPLIQLGINYRFNIIQLIDFCKILNAMRLITNNRLFQINRELRELKNISKHKEKEIKTHLQR